MIGEIVARRDLWYLFVLILSLDENVIVFKFFIFIEVPKVDLVSSHCREFKQLSFTCYFLDGDVVQFV